MRFTARECDVMYLGANSNERTGEQSQKVKALAREIGREIHTATALMVVLDESRATRPGRGRAARTTLVSS